MTIYEYTDYQKFLNDWLGSQPKRGRGLPRQWAAKLSLHSTFVSQVLLGKKHLSFDHGAELCELLGLSEAEEDYFTLLLMHKKAGTEKLRKKLERRISEEQKKSQVLRDRLKIKYEMTADVQSLFYSTWLYSAIRNLSALPRLHAVELIAEHLKMPRSVVQEAVEFLLSHGLCVMEKGKLQPGPRRTHVSATSPFVLQHHKNWRLKGFHEMSLRQEGDRFFTFPFSASKADNKKIFSRIIEFIEEIHDIVGPSDSESARCLNIDYFGY